MNAGNSEQLDRIERLLGGLLSIQIDRHLREYPALGSAKATKIEQVLSEGGFSSVEIAKLLGKSRQAVSQNLAK